MAASKLRSSSTSSTYDIQTCKAPPSLIEMAILYCPSFHILASSGYNGNACGVNEQGIKIPLENLPREASFGLGYNPFKPTKASKRPSLNVKIIFSSNSLSIVNPQLIDLDSSPSLDIFSTDDSLAVFLGVYDNLPRYHCNCGFPCCLNVEAYFEKDTTLGNNNKKMIHEFPQPMDVPQQSNHLVGVTIDVKMDPYDEEKTIKIGESLTDDEQDEYPSLLHECLEIFVDSSSIFKGGGREGRNHNPIQRI